MQKCLVCYGKSEDGPYHLSCSKKLFGTAIPPTLDISPTEIEEMAQALINKRFAVPGVQKKISLTLTPTKTSALDSKFPQPPNRLTLVGVFGGTHILKPPSNDFPEMPEIENLTMQMAEHCGIETAAHGLIRTSTGELAYLTKRFDRVGMRKIAVEDFCQLSEMLSEDKYKSSHESTGRMIRKFATDPGDVALHFFERTVFSFLTGNADMHLKNHSLIEKKLGLIQMSPAYDLLSTRLLIAERDDPEETALPLNGKKTKLKTADFFALGHNLKIPEKALKNTFERFFKKRIALFELLDKAILSASNIAQYKILLHERFKRLEDFLHFSTK